MSDDEHLNEQDHVIERQTWQGMTHGASPPHTLQPTIIKHRWVQNNKNISQCSILFVISVSYVCVVIICLKPDVSDALAICSPALHISLCKPEVFCVCIKSNSQQRFRRPQASELPVLQALIRRIELKLCLQPNWINFPWRGATVTCVSSSNTSTLCWEAGMDYSIKVLCERTVITFYQIKVSDIFKWVQWLYS